MAVLSVVLASSVLAVFLSCGWIREIRHRRSLQSILRRVFEKGSKDDEAISYPSKKPTASGRSSSRM